MDSAETAAQDISLFFIDGFVIERKRVLIAAKLNALAEEYFSRVLYFWDENWFTTDITDSVHSVCYDPVSDLCLWLGQAGTVTGKKRGAAPVVSRINDADRFGNLNKIRRVEEQMFICGYGGQIYRNSETGWLHADENVLVSKPGVLSLDLLDIDGTAANDIYTVGTGGAIFHFDGTKWEAIDSGTNVHLTTVHCVSRDEVYVCGYRGTLLRGSGNIWENISHPDIQDNFYGMESYRGSVYLARNSGLLQLTNGELSAVNIGIQKSLTFNKLNANDGVLWSFGSDDLIYFDGEKWNEVVPPHNQK